MSEGLALVEKKIKYPKTLEKMRERTALRDLASVRYELDKRCSKLHAGSFPGWLAERILSEPNSKLAVDVIGKLLPSTQEIIHSHQLDIDPQALQDLVKAATSLQSIMVDRNRVVIDATDAEVVKCA